MNLSFKEYILQDIRHHFSNIGVISLLSRYIRIPAVKILLNYRLCQYVESKNGGGILYKLLKFRMLLICNKYSVTIDEKLKAGSGLYFPHNGPFVINGSSIIGENCIIHPQVLIGGDRGKGAPTIGNNVFIGNGAKIIGNCKIGDWVFITPGAVITKDIPSGSLVGCGLNNIINNDGKKHCQMYIKG